MKRILALSAVALGCGLAAHRASAQEPPPVDAAKEQYQRAYQRAIDFLIQHNEQKTAPGAQGADRQSLREKLRPLVEESFDARQRLQQAELKELRRRLAEIEQAISTREKNKDVIINSRVDELVNIDKTRDVVEYLQDGEIKFKAIERSNPQQHINTAVTPPVISATPPVAAPPGTVAVVRHIQETVEVNGERKTITRPITEYVEIPGATVPQPEDDEYAPSAARPRATFDSRPGEAQGAASADGAFDLATRERLARLEWEEAEANAAAAKQDLSRLQALSKQGSVSASEVRAGEKEQRQGEYEVKRAKLKLQGLAAQRAELEAAAEASVAEAGADVEKAVAKIGVAEAYVAAAVAEKEKLKADVEVAEANRVLGQATYEGKQKLFDAKSIDRQLLEEALIQAASAKAALDGAKAAAAKGDANVQQAKSALAEARGELNLAKSRLETAEARRDRLIQAAAPGKSEP